MAYTYDDLVEAVRKHSGLDDDQIREAAAHGADAGWAGFTYTADGAEFTRDNDVLVWALLGDEAEDRGFDNVVAYVATFHRADMTWTPDGFQCLLAWWALEAAGRHLSDESPERR